MANGNRSAWGWVAAGLGVLALLFFSQVPLRRNDRMAGKPAPELRFKLQNGKATSLAQYQGKVVLLNFWAHWCGPCIEEMPSLAALEKTLATDPNFQMLALHVDDFPPGTPEHFKGPNNPKELVFDVTPQDVAAYGIEAIPVTVLLDKKGNIRRVYQGPRNWMHASVQKEIRALLSE